MYYYVLYLKIIEVIVCIMFITLSALFITIPVDVADDYIRL